MVHVSFFTLFMKQTSLAGTTKHLILSLHGHNNTSYLIYARLPRESTLTQQNILSLLRFDWLLLRLGKAHNILCSLRFQRLVRLVSLQQFNTSYLNYALKGSSYDMTGSNACPDPPPNGSQGVLLQKKSVFPTCLWKSDLIKAKKGSFVYKISDDYRSVYIRCSCLGNRVWGIVDNQNGYISSIVNTRHNAPICYTLDH